MAGGARYCLPTVATFAVSLLFLLVLDLPTTHSLSSGNDPVFFPSFTNVANGTNVVLLKDAGVGQGALQITPDTLTQISQLANKSGRVLLPKPFKLWEDVPATDGTNATTTYVASFNTTFTINIYRPNGTTPGEGFAFVIVPSLDAPPPGSEGRYLGLTNASLDGDPSNHLVAVELDTVKESFDPDDNHVGLDVNSVVSNVTANLTAFGIEIAPVNATNYTVWVDYDGAARHIRVYMSVAGKHKLSAPVLSAPLDLSDVVLQNSYFGFAASTGTTYQLNCVLAWNLTVEKLSDDDDGTPAWKLGVIIAAPVAFAALVVGLLVGLYMRRRKVSDDPSMLVAGTLKSLPGTPREFEFRELRKATNNFDEKMKLGQGGFGVVYRGVLQGENKEVAVKKFSRGSHGQDDFLKELTIINRLRHKHLVPLVGWCHNKGMLLLVYDYMPNGSLDQHLHGGRDRPLLSWERRYNIIAGVASALHYLHDEYDQRVVHRDLKTSNVMLDAGFNARLGDFGLARALDTDKTSYAEIELGGIPGTLGYIAPECFHTGKATRQSDVFGFGAVVLEVVCGRRPRCDVPGAQFLADWVWKLHGEGRILDAVDQRLAGPLDQGDAKRLLLLGLACSHPMPAERPKTDGIVQILSRSVAPPLVAPLRPAFVWPAGPIDEDENDDADHGTSRRLSRTSTSMSLSMTSSHYASSSGVTPKRLSREGPAGGHPIADV
ncbi:lectin-like protein kinase [Musa troglodytarum]|uniref:non-specific serine/threonine protein kinase n=1 Tax=Musa troglodytarum TaxID=320322 RepID=A0A9E7G5D4_9LILI|nr:lectin-like protein kinase [Musa troglodytarum]